MVTSTDTIEIPNELDELARLLRGGWDEKLERLRAEGIPLMETPPAGGDGGDGGDDGDGGEGEGDPAGGGDGGGDGDGDGDGDGGDGPEGRSGDFPWDEHNRLKREAAEAQKRARAAEREAKKQREKERRESGQYDELLAEKDEEVAAAASRAEAAEYQLEQFQRRIRIQGVAQRLGFKDTEDAVRFLDEDDTEDDVSTERALKRLAREKPYLVDAKRSSGAPVNGERSATLTLDDIKKMSQDEINARWEEVQTALAQGSA
jgi:hypothetical protein